MLHLALVLKCERNLLAVVIVDGSHVCQNLRAIETTPHERGVWERVTACQPYSPS